MFKYLVLFLVLFLWPLQMASAQETPKAAFNQKYLEMVKAARNMPENFDFKAVRELYPKTSFYSPFGEMGYKDELLKLMEKARAGDKNAAQDSIKMADHHFAHYKSHFYIMGGIASKYIADDMKFHDWAVRGVINSMMADGNGSSTTSAIKVLDVGEEYFLIKGVFKGRPAGQSVLNKDGKVFDVMAYTDTAGNKKEVYFDVTGPFSAYPVSEKP